MATTIERLLPTSVAIRTKIFSKQLTFDEEIELRRFLGSSQTQLFSNTVALARVRKYFHPYTPSFQTPCSA